MKKIQLSDHFTYSRLLRFVLPSVIMMVFTSVYGVVDGIFVSNLVGKTAFAAVNLIWPVVMMLGTLGFMFGAGGSALVAKILGEGDSRYANRIFSMLIYSSFVIGILLSVGGVLGIESIVKWLGAEGELAEDCILYGKILFPATAFFVLQNEFQNFLVVAEKPKLGLVTSIWAGVTNLVLDWLFIGVFRWGIGGAALATGLSQTVGALIPLWYFLFCKQSVLRLGKTGIYGKAFVKACTNGSSEMLTNISLSVVNILYNFQMMKFAGEDGVSAYGVMMYVNFLFISLFLGYSMGVSPIVSYHFGAKNQEELKNIFRKSMVILAFCSVGMFLGSELLSRPLSRIYVGYDQALYQLTCRGFLIYAVSFLFTGVNIFSSAFFTALNNGFVSAMLSFFRTLLFQAVCVLVLPIFWELDGVWSAIVVAEFLALILSIGCFLGFKKRYGY